MLLIFEVVRPESGADPNGAQDRSLSELVVECCLFLVFKGNVFLIMTSSMRGMSGQEATKGSAMPSEEIYVEKVLTHVHCCLVKVQPGFMC